MGRPSKGVEGYTSKQIKRLLTSKKSFMVGIRLHVVYQMSLGHSSREVAEWYQVSFKQVCNWVDQFEKQGLEGLKDRPGRGRKPKLSDSQRQRLARLVAEESPSDHGYNSDTWTGPLLIDWIRQNFRVSYKKAQIYNILKQLGFSWQKAKGQPAEADPAHRKAFVRQLKKNS